MIHRRQLGAVDACNSLMLFLRKCSSPVLIAFREAFVGDGLSRDAAATTVVADAGHGSTISDSLIGSFVDIDYVLPRAFAWFMLSPCLLTQPNNDDLAGFVDCRWMPHSFPSAEIDDVCSKSCANPQHHVGIDTQSYNSAVNSMRASPLLEIFAIDGGAMKRVLALAVLVATLSGCAIVPVGYPGPRYAAVAVPAPVVVVRPWYYRRWGY